MNNDLEYGHTDHPLRHYDQTCAACEIEALRQQLGQTGGSMNEDQMQIYHDNSATKAELRSVIEDMEQELEVLRMRLADLTEWNNRLLAAPAGKFRVGDVVKKVSGSEWEGVIVGTYSTALTPEGYAVESMMHNGSVQIYPAKALEYLR